MSLLREADAEPLPGYRLIEPLGTGGFGEVWKCEAPGGLYKAIKFVYGNLNSLDTDAARAEQERGALERVKGVRHPFVLSIEQIQNVDGELVIVTELADKSLHDLFVEHQAAGLVGIPRDDLLRYLRDAAEALDHMNEKYNLQHLDIKPRNLFLVSDRVKVADFGLVKHLERQSGILASVTPLYASPETFNGKISQHSDQYSLAIVYHELLTGQRPFNGKNARQLALQHTQEEPELRGLPEIERPAVARALAKDPNQRFPNCLAFVKALYNASPQAKAPAVNLDGGQRPKTMSETMEDIFLDQHGENITSAVLTEAPPPLEEERMEEVSELGLMMHQPQTGVLRPTVVLGLGSFGRRALLELRCRFLDRFGELSKIPSIQFLYADTDSESVRNASRAVSEVAALPNEVCHLPLQPVGNYRRRMLDQLSDWLPREKLYNMPRSLQTQGSRALGRLAFADNHLRFMARLRKEIEHVAHPDVLYQSVNQTGLALRNNRPRIFVLAAGGGGGSGLIVDLGYGLRRVLHQLKQAEGEVILMLFCGAPDDPATPRQEQANVYATLTELNHFSDPGVTFTAQYSPDGPRTAANCPPYHHVYMLKLANRSPECLRDAVAHLGSYLFHELTTPLGLRLDQSRRRKKGEESTRFRSFGTYAVWFPRGLLLRLAARQACVRLLTDWQKIGEPTAKAEVEAACARALADPELRFESACQQIEREAARKFDNNLSGALSGLLAKLEEQTMEGLAQDDPSAWARHAVSLLQDLVGSSYVSEHESGWRRSRLGRALVEAIQKVAGEWDKKLSAVCFDVMEHSGRRVAAAEAALHRLIDFCRETAATQARQLEEQLKRTQQARDQLEAALQDCLLNQTRFSLFGGRARRQLRVFMDYLAAFGRQRLAEEVIAAGVQFFGFLQGKFDERIRDLTFCRQRLRSLQNHLATPPEATVDITPVSVDTTPVSTPFISTESYWDAIRQSTTARLVLPDGEVDLDKASSRFIDSLKTDQWIQLDQTLQDRVLAPLGGLHKICMTGSDLTKFLSIPLTTAAAAALGEYLPITDVAQVEFSAATAGKSDVQFQIRTYFAQAAPLVSAGEDKHQFAFLLAPGSDAGKAFGDEACRAVGGLEIVRAPGQADLMFCREQGGLAIEDIRPLLRSCRTAYQETMTVPTSSPHARFDIVDWLPLDP